MGARRVFCLLSLACILWSPSLHAVSVASCDSACQTAQVRALMDLYTATQGSQWHVSEGWSSLTSATSMSTVCAFLENNLQGWCCTNNQALCPAEFGVSALLLFRNNLKGTLPASFSALGPTLISLILSSTEPQALNFCYLHLQLLRPVDICCECR